MEKQAVITDYKKLCTERGVPLSFTYEEWDTAGKAVKEVDLDFPVAYFAVTNLEPLLSLSREGHKVRVRFYAKRKDYGSMVYERVYVVPVTGYKAKAVTEAVVLRGDTKEEGAASEVELLVAKRISEWDKARHLAHMEKENEVLRSENTDLREAHKRLEASQTKCKELEAALEKKSGFLGLAGSVGSSIAMNFLHQNGGKVAQTLSGAFGLPQDLLTELLSPEQGEKPTQAPEATQAPPDDLALAIAQLEGEDRAEVQALLSEFLQKKYSNPTQKV